MVLYHYRQHGDEQVVVAWAAKEKTKSLTSFVPESCHPLLLQKGPDGSLLSQGIKQQYRAHIIRAHPDPTNSFSGSLGPETTCKVCTANLGLYPQHLSPQMVPQKKENFLRIQVESSVAPPCRPDRKDESGALRALGFGPQAVPKP